MREPLTKKDIGGLENCHEHADTMLWAMLKGYSVHEAAALAILWNGTGEESPTGFTGLTDFMETMNDTD